MKTLENKELLAKLRVAFKEMKFYQEKKPILTNDILWHFDRINKVFDQVLERIDYSEFIKHEAKIRKLKEYMVQYSAKKK